MTWPEPAGPDGSRVAVVGTGLIGTSVAMAAAAAGHAVSGWDPDPDVLSRAAARAGLSASPDLSSCVERSDLVVVCAPVAAIPAVVAACLRAAPGAVVTDAGSVKVSVFEGLEEQDLAPGEVGRFVGGHPLGGSERVGPEGASPSLLDGAVWLVVPGPRTEPEAVDRVTGWVATVGAVPVRMDPGRHDRLVAVVSHLPQVASTALMALAADEEADDPDLLRLAGGGFRDLTRLAASSPPLWREILRANRVELVRALDAYAERLRAIRDAVAEDRAGDLEATLHRAKAARLGLAAKPSVKAGVAVLQVPVPDWPGVLAELTSTLGERGVNIEDLQIVHAPRGGRGTVHLTVAEADAPAAEEAVAARGFTSVRLA